MESYSFDNHRSKCRFCVRSMSKRQKHVEITEDIQEKFFSITQLILKKSPEYSDKICSICDKELECYHQFKNDLIERQQKLNDFLSDYNDEDPINILVKSESEDPEIPSVIEISIKEELKPPESEVPKEIQVNEVKEESKQPRKKRTKKIEASPSLEDLEHLVVEPKLENPEIEKPPKRKCERKNKIYPDGINMKRKQKLTASVIARMRISFCKDCKRDVRDINRHWRRVHSNIKNFICDECGYSCYARSSLQNHLKTKHMAKEEREVFKCRYCEFTSLDKCYIRSVHEKTHFGKNFRCDLCGKSYYTKHRLKAHILEAHEKKSRYNCQFCPKSYFTVDKQKEHELVNHIKKGVRDIICQLCSAGFITKTQLQSHTKTVHTEGHLKCDFEGCTKTFHKMSKKEIHIRVHTRENKHKCEICNQTFPYTWVLSKHKRVVHGIEKNK